MHVLVFTESQAKHILINLSWDLIIDLNIQTKQGNAKQRLQQSSKHIHCKHSNLHLVEVQNVIRSQALKKWERPNS